MGDFNPAYLVIPEELVITPMKEHQRYYKKEITVLWQSPPYSKWPTLRVEENTKEIWKKTEGFEYLRNDRFIINPEIRQVKIKVRKEWVVDF